MELEALIPRSEEPQTASYSRSEESNTTPPFCFLKAILILSFYCLVPKIFLVNSGRQTDRQTIQFLQNNTTEIRGL
jgi:hypothetical protein